MHARGTMERPFRDRHQTRRAFSLLELVLTLGIILVLVTLYWKPSGPSKQARRMAACQVNLQKLFMAMEIYAGEHAGRFPNRPGAESSEGAFELLVPKYTSDLQFFLCPGTGAAALDPDKPLGGQRVSYSLFMGQDARGSDIPLVADALAVTQVSADTNQVIFSSSGKPPGNNHQQAGGNILFTDGHVEKSAGRPNSPWKSKPGVIILNPRK